MRSYLYDKMGRCACIIIPYTTDIYLFLSIPPDNHSGLGDEPLNL